MSIIHLKPNESLKLSSKSFTLISEKIKSDIFTIEDQENGATLENNQIYEVKYTDFQPKTKEKIIFEMKEARKESIAEEDIKINNDNLISKFLITDRYDEQKIHAIKSAIAAKINLEEKQQKYAEDVYKEKNAKFKEELEKRNDFVKVQVDTHPRGRLDLEYRKYHNLKSRVVNLIPIPKKRETIYQRKPLQMEEVIYDLYDNESWSIKDIQKFINLYFEYHKEFERIQEKMPNKKTSEIIALYDIINPVLLLKKVYKKCKRKSPANKAAFLRTALPLIKEKLLFILREKILKNYSNEAIITLGEAIVSRRDLIETFSQHKQ